MRIIATDVANLTDARYFAAWGVEAMAYNIDPNSENSLSPTQLKEIVDWVEGPKSMIKMEGLEIPESLDEVTDSVEYSEYHRRAVYRYFDTRSNLRKYIESVPWNQDGRTKTISSSPFPGRWTISLKNMLQR